MYDGSFYPFKGKDNKTNSKLLKTIRVTEYVFVKMLVQT